jgi:hypothetical protein
MDPEFAGTERPAARLEESVLVPADPHWWSGLAVRLRSKTGGVYTLNASVSPTDDLDEYWEYHVRGLRRLETITQRSEADYLSMMLEELEVARTSDVLLGRCIHWDTAAVVGDAPAEASLRHLDLAINVYTDKPTIDQRLAESLRNGKVVDATFRAHLLRIESAPVGSVIPLTLMFFRSTRLLRDLVNDQFRLRRETT